ncbi:hypothetical protein GW17_00042552 [Ensete ventricosum]|nr:hypothetical protein GW17_00042552 [Ensete ventricosum]RZS24335.1 hypothetical protein BHM03_00057400 [Ensete ventricosum]
MMISYKACFSKHSQWPPESFRLAGLESLCCSIFPWMSEIDPCVMSIAFFLLFVVVFFT